MVKRTGRGRRKTRSLFRKKKNEKGKISIKRYMSKFETGDRVHLIVEPSVHKGMYFRRFVGKTGQVEGKQGTCYQVKINDNGKDKQLIIHPIHLRKVKWIQK